MDKSVMDKRYEGAHCCFMKVDAKQYKQYHCLINITCNNQNRDSFKLSPNNGKIIKIFVIKILMYNVIVNNGVKLVGIDSGSHRMFAK